MQSHGDWTEQLNDYCPTSGLPLDDLITDILAVGFDASDLKHLERLTDPLILSTLPPDKKYLVYNNKADVGTYLDAWANNMENELIRNVSINEIVDHQLTVHTIAGT